MLEDIVHRASYRYAPDDVWRALTTPAALGAWLMQNDFTAPRRRASSLRDPGHAVRPRPRPRRGQPRVQIAMADPVPRRIPLNACGSSTSMNRGAK